MLSIHNKWQKLKRKIYRKYTLFILMASKNVKSGTRGLPGEIPFLQGKGHQINFRNAREFHGAGHSVRPIAPQAAAHEA